MLPLLPCPFTRSSALKAASRGRRWRVPLLVAEGVETEAEREDLADLGCALLQGFVIGRPVPSLAVSAPEAR